MTTCLGKSCSIRFTASAFRKLWSIYVFSCFPFGFERSMWDLIVSVLIIVYLFTYYAFVASDFETERQQINSL